MLIAIIAIFCAGIGNFAMHRAFMESDDPLIQQMVQPLADKVGPNITYVFEFLLLDQRIVAFHEGAVHREIADSGAENGDDGDQHRFADGAAGVEMPETFGL